jgi:hypothetical protein
VSFQPVSVVLDWIRCVGEWTEALRLWEWIAARWGDDFEELPKGLYRFGRRIRWSNGVELWLDHHGDNLCAVEIPGGVLELMDGAERVAVLAELVGLGCRPTRLDVAIDRRDPKGRLDLVQRADLSCRRGELCGFKKSRRIVGHGESRADSTGYTLYVGKKGSCGGGKSLRVYDKGLEQNEKRRARFKPNQWHRWEVQFEHERAQQAAAAIIDAGEGWHRVAASLAVGVLDFRQVSPTGRRELARREPVKWFYQFLELLKASRIETAKAGRSARLDRFVAWFRGSVGRTLSGMAEASGLTPEAVFRELVEGVEPGGADEIVSGWAEYKRTGGTVPDWAESD